MSDRDDKRDGKDKALPAQRKELEELRRLLEARSQQLKDGQQVGHARSEKDRERLSLPRVAPRLKRELKSVISDVLQARRELASSRQEATQLMEQLKIARKRNHDVMLQLNLSPVPSDDAWDLPGDLKQTVEDLLEVEQKLAERREELQQLKEAAEALDLERRGPSGAKRDDGEDFRDMRAERDPLRAEPLRAEALRAEPLRAEALRAEPLRAEPLRAEPLRAEPLRAEPLRAEPLREEPLIAQAARARPEEPAFAHAVPVAKATLAPKAEARVEPAQQVPGVPVAVARAELVTREEPKSKPMDGFDEYGFQGQNIISTKLRLCTMDMNEPFNPTMWHDFAANCGHPEADMSDPKVAARFLLSRLKSSVLGGRRNPVQVPQPSMYAPNGNPQFSQGFGVPAANFGGYAQPSGQYRPMMNFGGFAQ